MSDTSQLKLSLLPVSGSRSDLRWSDQITSVKSIKGLTHAFQHSLSYGFVLVGFRTSLPVRCVGVH